MFGAGGMVSALVFPIHIFLLGLAFPLGWMEGPDYESLHALVTHPVTRLYLFVFISRAANSVLPLLAFTGRID